ncbi:MAG TPA: Gfo/Idh/MocA family oxidoreductase [Mycobacteriales bacterium]|nr:Gfo/Idh/MocA family oxidoreductase [Mycobacteriales bacterium]
MNATRGGGMLKFGIVGCGGIGAVHADLIASIPDRARLVAVADTVPTMAAGLAGRHGVDALAGVEQLCARADVDAVSVCLPNGMHADAAVTALNSGKHVLIEKPIDITLAAADRIIAAERRSGLVAGVVCQRRFQPAFAFLHEAAHSGRLGRLTSGLVHTTYWRPQAYYDSAAWRGTWDGEGGGALITQGSHAVDLLVWMMGEPVRVSAFAGVLAHRDIEVEDTLSASVLFAGGAIGTITATTAGYPGLPVRMQLSGDAGSAVVDGEELRYLHTRDGGGAARADQSASAPAAHGPSSVEVAHAAQYVDFIDAVERGRPPLVTTADGRRVLALILAAYESARSGGRPVAV